jgi:hypothetical protein
MDPVVEPTIPERSLAIRRATARLCLQLGWSPVHEMPLPNNRRADIMALRPDGGFACIEVKSGPRDFLTDNKWPEYRDYSDSVYFAVDMDFPQDLLPAETGLIVACGGDAEVLREPAVHTLSPARRRALLHRFATLAAQRLAWLQDPAGQNSLRMALRAE